MPDKILLKRSLTTGNVPTTASLDVGELAINVADGKLFFKQSGSGEHIVKETVVLNTPLSGNILLTGSLVGTSSFATTAATASLLLGSIESASFATTASYALAAIAQTPAGTVSSSQQVLNYNIFAITGSNTFDGNQIVSGAIFFDGGSSITGNVSNLELFAAPTGEIILQQGFEYLKVSNQKVLATNIDAVSVTGSFSGSLIGTSSWANTASMVEYANVNNKPSLVSASSQVSYTGISNIPTNIVSSSTQLPAGIVSSSTQVQNYNIFATTGSNTFVNNQMITGSVTITGNLVVQGSSSISYVSQSTLNIGTNLVTVNVQNPSIRFGGLAVIDSGSSPQVSGSLLFDSVENQWLYVHQNQGVVTSSILIMGPETYNNIGNETHPTTNRVMKSLNDEHIGNSQITDDGTTVSIPNNLTVSGIVSASQFRGNFTGSFLGTSSLATSASYALPSGLPSGLVSSSTQIVQFGTIRLAVGTNRSNASAFYFNSNTRTASDSSSPGQDTAFLISSTGLSTVTVYLRQDNAGPNNTVVGVAKNANATAFSTATLVTSSSLALVGDTIQTYTFSGLTLNQFDTIHIYCDPTSTPGSMFAVVIVS